MQPVAWIWSRASLTLATAVQISRAHPGSHVVVDGDAAHDQDSIGDGAQFFIELRHLAAPFHRLDQ